MISVLGWKANFASPLAHDQQFVATVHALEAGNLRFEI